MKTYRIIPNREQDMLSNMIKGMELSITEIDIFDASILQHIEISSFTEDSNSNYGEIWEIVIYTPTAIKSQLRRTLENHIKQNFGLREVKVYFIVSNIEISLETEWQNIVADVTEGQPVIRKFLENIDYKLDDNSLELFVTGDFWIGTLMEFNIPENINKIIRNNFGINLQVSLSTKDNYAELSKSVAYNTAEIVPDVKLEVNKNTKNKAININTPVNTELIFGKNLTGEVINADKIDGESKGKVILEGWIYSIRVNIFNTGNRMLSFDFSDNTDGISCKIFLRQDKSKVEDIHPSDSFIDQLKDGMAVRLSGRVKFDTFRNELVMNVDSIARRTITERQDKAEIKRIELHAHTKMSDLDAVISPKKLVETAAKWGWDAIAITDHGGVQAFPEAANVVHDKKLNIKVIYGLEGYLVDDMSQRRANHIILLAKNRLGLINLYKLVSISHIRFFARRPRLLRSIIEEHREGLIIGSACEAGELIRAIIEGKRTDELESIANFYDYLEIQPIHNNDFLKRSDKFPHINNDDDLRNINIKVAELAKKLDKPLVATCDVHFLNPEDAIYRTIIQKAKGFDDAEIQPPLYLRTTEEMLLEFDYLGEELAYEAVITNPRKISDEIEYLIPIPNDLYAPKMDGADVEIREMSYKQARMMYGNNLPQIVVDRLEQELEPIIGHGFAALYLISQRLVKKSNNDGYLVGSRGSVGSSLVATVTGITEINPLPPHYRCPYCQYNEFIKDGSINCGYDLPDKICPVCEADLIKDGHDIPFAVFLGFDGDKVPDIDLNFSGDYQSTAHKYTEVLFGKTNVFRAGSIQTIANQTAWGYVKGYFKDKEITKNDAYIAHLAKGIYGVKTTTGQHPAGIMVVPRSMDIHTFSPLQKPANNMNNETLTTHFDYHSISSRLVKLDILGHDDPTVIKMLEDLTHRDPKTIPLDDKPTMAIFSDTEALGVNKEDLGANSGTFGIPEFRTNFTRQMIDDTHPDCFADLVRISGFSHGEDVWLNNAQNLIRSGQCTLKDAISARDDIMMYLIHRGIDSLVAFNIMENVRKGKGVKEEFVEILNKNNIPEWYVNSCQKIKYLFPRAHASAYVMMAYRIAYCKVHYPLAYYAAYFSIRADEFDANIIARGKNNVRREMDLLEKEKAEKNGKLDDKKEKILIVLQIAWEMFLRGFTCDYVDIYESDATKFIVRENSLLPPISSLNGMGTKASYNIVDSRKNGQFSSIEDIHRRANLSKTHVEILRTHGCFAGMYESDQIELFAI